MLIPILFPILLLVIVLLLLLLPLLVLLLTLLLLVVLEPDKRIFVPLLLVLHGGCDKICVILHLKINKLHSIVWHHSHDKRHAKKLRTSCRSCFLVSELPAPRGSASSVGLTVNTALGTAVGAMARTAVGTLVGITTRTAVGVRRGRGGRGSATQSFLRICDPVLPDQHREKFASTSWTR